MIRALERGKEKQEFAKKIAEVYEKHEDIDYTKNLREERENKNL
jgi:hypothetical protein